MILALIDHFFGLGVLYPDQISRMELFKFVFGPISSFFDFVILSPPPVHMGLELLIRDPLVGIGSCNGIQAVESGSVSVLPKRTSELLPVLRLRFSYGYFCMAIGLVIVGARELMSNVFFLGPSIEFGSNLRASIRSQPYWLAHVDVGVVKDDLFMRESVKTADVWMGPETEVDWDRQAGVVENGFFVRKRVWTTDVWMRACLVSM